MENTENTTQPPATNKLKELAITIIVVGCVWYFFLGGQQMFVRQQMSEAMKEVPAQMQQINNQVANDAVTQYEIAARQGDKMQMYTQAGLCAAAFLQAKDEMNYNKWKDIEEALGKSIGLKSYK